jgi:hypothetical protein
MVSWAPRRVWLVLNMGGQGAVRTGCSRSLLVPRCGVFSSEVRASSRKLRESSDVTLDTLDGCYAAPVYAGGPGPGLPVLWTISSEAVFLSHGTVVAGKSVGSTKGNRMYYLRAPWLLLGVEVVPCLASLLSWHPLTRGHGTCVFLSRAILGSTSLIATLAAHPPGMQLPKPVSFLSASYLLPGNKLWLCYDMALCRSHLVCEHLEILFGLGLPKFGFSTM